jgi:hypothetical protein
MNILCYLTILQSVCIYQNIMLHTKIYTIFEYQFKKFCVTYLMSSVNLKYKPYKVLEQVVLLNMN